MLWAHFDSWHHQNHNRSKTRVTHPKLELLSQYQGEYINFTIIQWRLLMKSQIPTNPKLDGFRPSGYRKSDPHSILYLKVLKENPILQSWNGKTDNVPHVDDVHVKLDRVHQVPENLKFERVFAVQQRQSKNFFFFFFLPDARKNPKTEVLVFRF